MVSGGFSLNLN